MSAILEISEIVTYENEVVKEYTPANNEVISIRAFEADSKPNDNSYAVVEWGDDAGGWLCVWGIWGSSPMKHYVTKTGDGTKKVRLRAINNEASDTMMSAIVEIVEAV